MEIGVWALYLAGFLFVVGLFVVLTKKNIIFVLIGTELMLNAANLNLIVFSNKWPNNGGQVFTLFTIVIAAAEVAIALALLLNIFKLKGNSDLDQINELGH